MMEELLLELIKKNIVIRVQDGDLKVKFPKGFNDDNILSQIRSKKTELISFITDQQGLTKKYTTIPQASLKELYVLSSVQRRLYFLYESDENSITYNSSLAIRLEGELDKTRLIDTFEKLIRRHESLRTSFEVLEGEVFQRINEQIDFDIQHFESTENGAEVIINQFVRPFDLRNDSLIRVGLIKISPTEHILLLDMHHIITDGVSRMILMKDFMALYENKELAEMTLQYKDYAEWQQGHDQQEKLKGPKKFWLNEFSDEVSVLDLPTDFSRPKVKTRQGNTINFTVGKEYTNQLKLLSEQESSTLFMTLLAIFNILLGKMCNQEEVVVGTSVAGREHSDLEGVMGLFINAIVLRNFPRTSLSFVDFLADVKRRSLACFDNQSYQYDELVEELKIPRDVSRNPLFDVMFVFQNFEQQELSIPDLKLIPYSIERKGSNFDITLTIMEVDGKLNLEIEYAKDLFEEQTIDRMVTYFNRIVEHVIADRVAPISSIDILSTAEKETLLYGFNDTQVAYATGKTVLDMYEDQVVQAPERKALVFQEKELNYNDFRVRVNQTSNYLEAQGVAQGDVVGLMSDLSIDLMVYVYAIMKVGAVYLPIDKNYPKDRINYILSTSGAKTVVCQENEVLGPTIQLLRSDTNTHTYSKKHNGAAIKDSDTAYIIYTSGSTGKPKGVEIPHSALYNYVSFAKSTYIKEECSPMALFTSISFDLTITSMFLPLTNGSPLIIYAGESPDLLVQRVFTDNTAEVIKLTPAHLKLLIEADIAISGVKRLIVGGESFDRSLAAKVYERASDSIEIYNEYGPTEATVGCVLYQYNPDDRFTSISLPIGTPIANTQIFILNQSNTTQPIGVPGELCISGSCLSKGYLNNDVLNSEKFIDNPYQSGQIMYKTGDLARWLPDGNVEFLGRLDEQVKIRGYRIELGEIQFRLASHKEVNEALVIALDREGEKQLIGYYTSNEELESAMLKDHLATYLPEYMLPEIYLRLENFPLTSNGKLDRKNLPDPQLMAVDDYIAPSNEIENKLVMMWSELLGMEKDKISVNSSFFELGGHSLKAISLLNKIKKEYSIKILMPDFFDAPTVSDLNKIIMLSKIKIVESEDKIIEEPTYRI